MYTVDNKFEIGEECYTAYRNPVKYKCPICEGKREFIHNGHTVRCRNCNGTGELHNAHQFVLEVGKVRIRRIIASILENTITIKYKVDCIENTPYIKNRSESTLFKTKEEAEEYCMKTNTEQIRPEF